MKSKVLIATYYWPPSGGPGVQRYLKFTRYLPDFEIEPLVLTVRNPTYPIRDESLLDEIPSGLKVYRSKTIEPFQLYAGMSGMQADEISPAVELEGGDSLLSSMAGWIRANIFIPDARAGWLLTAGIKAASIVEKQDVDTIITTGPPHSVHFIGKHLKKKHGIRWLADFRDPWSQIYYNQLLPRTAVAEQLDEKLEQMILKQADEVIVVSPSQAESFRQIVERGYQVITNGFDPADFDSIDRRAPERKRFLIRHIGTVGEAAIPVSLLRVLSSMPPSQRPDLEFIGKVHSSLQNTIRELELATSIQIRDYLPHRQALEQMCQSDALLLLIPDVEEIEHHIPGKLFEYLGSGRPIVLLGPDDGDSARILREEEAGLAVSFRDEPGIERALNRLLAGEIPDRGPQSQVDSRWSRVELTRALSRLILQPEPFDPLTYDR